MLEGKDMLGSTGGIGILGAIHHSIISSKMTTFETSLSVCLKIWVTQKSLGFPSNWLYLQWNFSNFEPLDLQEPSFRALIYFSCLRASNSTTSVSLCSNQADLHDNGISSSPVIPKPPFFSLERWSLQRCILKKQTWKNLQYGWWKKSCTSCYGKYPIIYRVYTSQVVVWDFFHQQYGEQKPPHFSIKERC